MQGWMPQVTLGSVVLDPCRMGNHGPDKLRVDTKERGGACKGCAESGAAFALDGPAQGQ